VRHLFFVHPAPFGAALAEQVGFDLIDCRDDLVIGDQIKEPVRLKVGNADGTDLSFCVQLLQEPPRRIVVGKGAVEKGFDRAALTANRCFSSPR